jgi:hypothetical protein
MIWFSLVYLVLFFVASTSGGLRVAVVPPFDMFFNIFVYGAFLVLLAISLVGKFSKDRITMSVLIVTSLFIFYVFAKAFLYEPRFVYSSLMLIFLPLLHCVIKSNDVYKFLFWSVSLLSIFTSLKIYDLYAGTQLSIIIDLDYFAAGEDFTFRLSNSLVFGQRNLAGGVVGALSVLLASLEASTKQRYNLVWILLFFIAISTFSNTGLIILLLSFVFSRPKTIYFIIPMLLIALIFLELNSLNRALDSLNTKLWTIGNYFGNLDLVVLFLGQITAGSEQSMWIESALLDLLNDLGLVGVLVLLFLSFTSGLLTHFSKLWLFTTVMFYLMFVFSNSTLNPPVLLIYVICMSLLTTLRTHCENTLVNQNQSALQSSS